MLDSLAILDYSLKNSRTTDRARGLCAFEEGEYMFKLGSRGLRRMALALGFLVLAVFSDSGTRINKHAGPFVSRVGNVMALYGAEAVTIDRNARDFKSRSVPHV